MKDTPLRAAVRAILLNLMAAHGRSHYRVLAEYQPTAQGRDHSAVYFFRVSDARHGWQQRKYSYPATAPQGSAVESQILLSTFQFGAYTMPDDAFAAVDLLEFISMLINSAAFVDAARAQGIGVQRITNVRTPYFRNENDRFEPSPSFDVVFSHKSTISPQTPFLDTLAPTVHRV